MQTWTDLRHQFLWLPEWTTDPVHMFPSARPYEPENMLGLLGRVQNNQPTYRVPPDPPDPPHLNSATRPSIHPNFNQFIGIIGV